MERLTERIVILEQRIMELERDSKKGDTILHDVIDKVSRIEKKIDGQVSFVAGVSAAISLLLFFVSSAGEKLISFFK